MSLKNLLKKKDKIKDEGTAPAPSPTQSPTVPEFTFMRTTTTTQEEIAPPTFPGDAPRPQSPEAHPDHKRLSSRFRRHSNAAQHQSVDEGKKNDRRLSERLHLSRDRSSSSVNVPEDLPSIENTVAKTVDDEASWEKRATLLAKGNSVSRHSSEAALAEGGGGVPRGKRSRSVSVSDAGGDVNIQEAIRLHEAGEYDQSTVMFGKLADPKGANNALSQVLYGLALRHAWGCTKNEELAVTYLSYAASNSADVESLALAAGMKKGGAAKGELTLAIFELGNCFRNGWGAKKDPVAAKQYYETAANLGDTDAMNEVAWCYLEGFGCRKDKFKAAQFLRLAESKGSKIVGNTW
ncbi:HCP-like protein [Mytilinidion resinicola]|uniref:HCP-like protein n=1 Tax=Mytilinidion resinicola TaxID=574789 RepID=A0A6A6YDL9_9PEZI|nr:HCP-like protein [Mytilinidion resinicola]KAF2806623.1 HCP-like protein [Mytilinidion resinicola]